VIAFGDPHYLPAQAGKWGTCELGYRFARREPHYPAPREEREGTYE